LEIGPGEGVLTGRLVDLAERVVAVEKDEQLAKFVEKKFSSVNLDILEEDILKVNLPLLIEKKEIKDYKLIANIPYYITGKILRLFLETKYKPKLLILLVQKEVAERICSKPGKMTLLSAAVNYFGKPELVDFVPKESFYPEPKVDSAILKITPYLENADSSGGHKYEYANKEREKKFFRLIRTGFASPRKTLVNNLSAGFHLSKEEVAEILKKAGIEERTRAQDLSLEDWQKLEKLF
jgi:16S rRNA (adenine1518-N6/adenine1519-N6)-dimethyltransferase